MHPVLSRKVWMLFDEDTSPKRFCSSHRSNCLYNFETSGRAQVSLLFSVSSFGCNMIILFQRISDLHSNLVSFMSNINYPSAKIIFGIDILCREQLVVYVKLKLAKDWTNLFKWKCMYVLKWCSRDFTARLSITLNESLLCELLNTVLNKI